MLLFLSMLLPPRAMTQKVNLPCELPKIAVAGDGSGVWVVCWRNWSAIRKARDAALPPPSPYERPSDVYWIANATGSPEKITDSDTDIRVIPAPSGSQSVIVVSRKSGAGRVLLYNRRQKVRELAVDPSFLLWAADAQRLYFYGGTTIQADPWNVLGIYNLSNGSVRRETLREPTEILRVCPATGEVYSVTPQYANFPGNTDEYTADIQFVRQIHGWVGARFSARCTFVASESDFHGPLPWTIYDTRSGERLLQFSAEDGDTKKDAYSLVAWNPKHDSVLLREHFSKKGERLLEVFDVVSGRVLETFPRADGAAWSVDGVNIIIADRNSLVWHPLKSHDN